MVGKKLKVSKGSWNVPVTVKYQWFANGKKIKKATKSSYKLTRTVKGRKISVKVTASAPGLTSKVVTVKFKGKVKEQWGKLTDDDLDVIDGKRDQLLGRIQERHGINKDEA